MSRPGAVGFVRVRRFFEDFYNGRHLDLLDELFSPSSTLHHGGQAHSHTVAEWKQILGQWTVAFPDLRFTLDDLIAEGDGVLARVTYRGTHRAPFWGIAPTGRPMQVTEMLLVRFEGGRMVEAWMEFDELGQHRQLGWPLEPAPGEGDETRG